MKFNNIFATLAVAAVSVSAAPGETNAHRMARGLPPLPPVRRATPVGFARRSTPSGTPPSVCNSGSVQCCGSVEKSTDPLVQTLSGLLGIVLGSSDSVGVNCTPISGGTSCTQQTVCCENNNLSGLLVVGCTPININL
ncbi:hypothetical protein E4T56_gene8521 [Termitomyces sp. T112]|nr:hypothetical protein E4T56_gene8521 [Termitomyces sp. T112]KAH0578604.1 hypothetical protein H2248_003743 [Termitomyces sp. 'cryptogamus']KAH0578605.1 hypothetical protein H2248_003743 [Termitomyces sp. 'cryptogamus']KNZ81335.1 Hydrophobin-1 [Termitomyces sp. J132]